MRTSSYQPDEGEEEAEMSGREKTAAHSFINDREIASLKAHNCYLFLIALILTGALLFLNSQLTQLRQGLTQNDNQEHLELVFPFPTLGMPRPGQPFNATPVGVQDLPGYDLALNQLLKPYQDPDCHIQRAGQAHQGFLLCGNHLAETRAVVTVGGGEDHSASCWLSSRLQLAHWFYGCHPDPSPICPSNSGRNRLTWGCPGPVTAGQTISLADILGGPGVRGQHLLLQIEAEGGEYRLLRTLPNSMLELVDMILVTLHFSEDGPPELWGNLDIFQSLTKDFFPVYYHMDSSRCFPTGTAPRGVPSRRAKLTLLNRRLVSPSASPELPSDVRSAPWSRRSFWRDASDSAECQLGP